MNTDLAHLILNIISIALAGVFLIFASPYVFFYFLTFIKERKIPKSDKLTRFAVLVPARNESKVIPNIIKSFKRQTYNKDYFDVYFIIENEDDPSKIIAEENGYKAFVRTRLTDERRTKGFALQECIEYLKENNLKYDAYVIFDADNVVEENFFEVMNNIRQKGVEVAIAYRNYTNANKNFFTASSSIFFSYMNNVTSKARTILFKKAVLMGTGYYVNADIIDEAGGWIFTGMTEDTELTTYCYKHNIRMKYTKRTCVYDEQAEDYKTFHNQLVRWIWGYLIRSKPEKPTNPRDHGCNKKFIYNVSKIEYHISFIPMAVVIAGLTVIGITYFILGFLSLGLGGDYYKMFFYGLLYLLLVITIFALQSFGQIIREGKRIRIGIFFGITISFIFWLYYFNLILAVFDGLFHKEKRTSWKVITHKGNITNKKARK